MGPNLISSNNLPSMLGLQQLTHQRRVDAVAAFFGGDLGLERHAEKREVADDVEDLVADEFVVEAERRFV